MQIIDIQYFTFFIINVSKTGGGAFEQGQFYVALSRCRTLEGIVLRKPIRPADVITDERVVDFYESVLRL